MAKKKIIKAEKKKTWWQVVLSNIFGLFFLIMPLLLLLSLVGYDAADPSFNKVTAGPVHNYLGTFGSYSADFILQSFGLALIIFLFVPILWGIGLLRYHIFPEYKIRILAWFVGMLSLACFIDLTCCTYFGSFDLPHNLTGEWSRFLSRPLNTKINFLNIPYQTLLLKIIILFVSVLSFNLAAGITFKTWGKLAKRLTAWCVSIGSFLWNLGRKAAKIRDFKEFSELNPSYLQSKMPNLTGGKLRIRREPGFDAAATENPATAPEIAANGGLKIEMPARSSAPEAAAIHQSSSFNPTFDFVSEGDVANQNVKKPSRKVMPEEAKTAAGKKNVAQSSTATQADLLSVPKTAAAKTTAALQPQQPARSLKSTAPVTPAAKSDGYVLPSIDLLSVPQNPDAMEYDEATLKENAAKLESVLNDFGIRGQIVKVRPGPVVTLYELEPAPGTRTARVIGLSDDIARSMSVASVRMAVVSGSNTIGIELPNAKRETVWLRELFEDETFKTSKNILNVALGKDIGGEHVYADLAQMPHLLVAGTTGSGKSVGVNSMILSLLYRLTPEQCKFIMIDPKQLEFSMYNGIPHLLTPVITDPAKAVVGLKWAVREMEDRYRSMALLNVRNIAGYNKKIKDMAESGKEMKKTIQTGFDKETGRPIYEEQVINTSPMPYIVIVVDEMADLMLVAGKEVEAAIQRLAQMARAAGIHLIMSTQRPSVDVITGTIKSNFPSRISFHVTTKIDSRTILGEQGAEQLLGMGDMLYMPSGMRPIRVHGCYVKDNEVESIVEFVKSQGEPRYVTDVTEGELNKDTGAVFDKGEMAGAGGGSDDELYRQAVEIVRADKKASTSYIQRKLRLGYNRAASLIERMEDEGVVTPPDRVGRRMVVGIDD